MVSCASDRRGLDHRHPQAARRPSPSLPHTLSPLPNPFVAYALPAPLDSPPPGSAHFYRRNSAPGSAIRLVAGPAIKNRRGRVDAIDCSAVTADLTGLLQAWSRGDAEALEQLAPLVHLELAGDGEADAVRRASGRRVAADRPRAGVLRPAARLARRPLAEPGPLLRDHGADDAAGTGGRRACATARPSAAAAWTPCRSRAWTSRRRSRSWTSSRSKMR